MVKLSIKHNSNKVKGNLLQKTKKQQDKTKKKM